MANLTPSPREKKNEPCYVFLGKVRFELQQRDKASQTRFRVDSRDTHPALGTSNSFASESLKHAFAVWIVARKFAGDAWVGNEIGEIELANDTDFAWNAYPFEASLIRHWKSQIGEDEKKKELKFHCTSDEKTGWKRWHVSIRQSLWKSLESTVHNTHPLFASSVHPRTEAPPSYGLAVLARRCHWRDASKILHSNVGNYSIILGEQYNWACNDEKFSAL